MAGGAEMSPVEFVFIDLSSIAHPIWHMSQADPDANATSQKILTRVLSLANSHAHVAICCDAGPSFRKDVSAAYKANRPESDAPLQHQITLACERLAADGFPVWKARGFEADDVIATVTLKALEIADASVLIVSSDKDLLQLVGPRVRAMSARDGAIFDDDAVLAKFGVPPFKMRDYLTLVGDASDNVKGAKNIGPKKAAELLTRFGSIDEMYAALTEGQLKHGFQPSVAGALRDFKPNLPTTRALITLRTDVEVPFDEILAARVPREAPLFETFATEDDVMSTDPQPDGQPAPPATETPQTAADTPTALVVRDEVLPAPAEWERGLDPRSMKDARVLAKDMYDSRMFSAYGSPQGVLSTIMVGRELGLPAMASLRSVHNIEGRHGLSAQLMVAIILKSGLAEYFEPISFSETEATYETLRKGGRNPIRLTHTIEMAKKAWAKSPEAWDKSGWGRVPTDMLVARATSRLARMVYPDLITGLYTPDELREISDSLAA